MDMPEGLDQLEVGGTYKSECYGWVATCWMSVAEWDATCWMSVAGWNATMPGNATFCIMSPCSHPLHCQSLR